MKIAFNSINVLNSSVNSSKCLQINGGDALDIRNNIFMNSGAGFCVFTENAPTNSNWDYNNYFSPSNKLGSKNGTVYSTLSSWANAIGGEANGLNLNPYFLNDESYKVYQCGLNGAGIPIPGISDDIEGDLRSPLAPDIGCDEFDFPSYLFGFVFNDLNHNGIQDEGESGLPGRLIAIEPGSIIAMTDSNGVWTGDYVPAGSYLATVHLPDNWQMSTPLSQPFFFMDTTTTTRIPAFGMYSTDVCPRAEVTVTAPKLVRCSPEQMVYVTAKNDVTATGVVIDSYVDVSLDPLISLDSASLAYSALGDNKFRFDVGDLNPGEEVNFSLSTTVSCDALKDQTLCIQANIYPVDSCAIDTTHNPPPPNGVTPCNLPWDHSSLSVDGWCDTDSVRFSVTNTGQPGNGDMVCYSPVRVWLDTVMVRFDSIQLAGGQTKYYAFTANGHTWRLEADQHPLHPGHSHPNAVVEVCGDTANWTPGLINLFPLDDADPMVDIYCGMVTGDWQQAEKIGYPEGSGGEGNILPGQGIQYQVNFQNMGVDTAGLVTIRDTLDMNLNIFTVSPGASSHPYTFRMFGQRVLEWKFEGINLPPSSVNEPGSQGFLTFSVDQNDSLPEGTQIFNTAYVFFEYPAPGGKSGENHVKDAPLVTNQTLHTINLKLIDPMLPESPGGISGEDTVCQGQSDVVYSVPGAVNATSYSWSLPYGVNGMSTTNTIMVSFSDTAVSGEIRVRGHNTLGDGPASVLMVQVDPLPAPGGAVFGPSFVYQGETGIEYSVPAIAHATSYEWTLPEGVSGSSTGRTITVSFSDTAISGLISVRGINACGQGSPSAGLFVNVSAPVPPNVILQDLSFDNNSVNCFNATQYITVAGNGSQFTVNPGATVNLIAGKKITLLPTTKVRSGGRLHAWITNTGNYCMNPLQPLVAVEKDSGEPDGVEPLIAESNVIRVYPNPTSGDIILEVMEGYASGLLVVDVYGIWGEKVLSRTITGKGKNTLSLSGKPNGVYFIRIMTDIKAEIVKIIKQ
ncbi:MAG TPA: T9SS type A sorting domain-containing protein [Bacteroidales bacterium]|nr:T9SS type A sorting domain-containing protein [Bacteroidales bacterium]